MNTCIDENEMYFTLYKPCAYKEEYEREGKIAQLENGVGKNTPKLYKF